MKKNIFCKYEILDSCEGCIHVMYVVFDFETLVAT
jgi:hypothetical protein